MEGFKVVRPKHLNHYGFLFGGFLLKWVDEIVWIAASRESKPGPVASLVSAQTGDDPAQQDCAFSRRQTKNFSFQGFDRQ